MRVIVTGSREHRDPMMVRDALDGLLDEAGHLFLALGDCPTGADAHALAWAVRRRDEGKPVGWKVFVARWTRFGRAAGPIRNQAMVDAGADLCLAFPQAGARNAGTRDCLERAHAAGIACDVRGMLHDGHVDQEPQVSAAQFAAVAALLRIGVDVVVDDTNLPDEAVLPLRRIADREGAGFAVWDLTDVPLEVCVRRDAARPRPVGEQVIRDMHARHVAGRPHPLPLPEVEVCDGGPFG